MIIGIDGNEANEHNRVGIGQYAFQVLTHLNKIQNLKVKSQKNRTKFTIYLKNNPLADMPVENEWWKYKVVYPKRLWTQIGLPLKLYLEGERPNVFFSPSHYAPRYCPIPSVISIMDLSYIYFPELFTKKDLYQLSHWTAYSVKHARRIFTISEYSKKTIIDHYKIAGENVIVTYPGYDIKKFKVQSSKFKVTLVKKRYGIVDDYILFVGTLQPRKNIERLIEAYEMVLKKHPKLQLVLIGKKGWLFEGIFQKVKDLGLDTKIIFCDFVSDSELAALYASARCFVLPSLYEGFGIPVVEAMACGCPVVASNTSSIPEIAGQAAILVDPQNVSDIGQGILRVLDDYKLRNNLIVKGLEQVKRFSWETCARIIYQELAKY